MPQQSPHKSPNHPHTQSLGARSDSCALRGSLSVFPRPCALRTGDQPGLGTRGGGAVARVGNPPSHLVCCERLRATRARRAPADVRRDGRALARRLWRLVAERLQQRGAVDAGQGARFQLHRGGSQRRRGRWLPGVQGGWGHRRGLKCTASGGAVTGRASEGRRAFSLFLAGLGGGQRHLLGWEVAGRLACGYLFCSLLPAFFFPAPASSWLGSCSC